MRASGCGSSASGRNRPSAKPQAKGTTMPAMGTAAAALPTLYQIQVGFHAGEQQAAAECRTAPCRRSGLFVRAQEEIPRFGPEGHSQPNSDGPSSNPARSSPITEGWPIRCMISPRPRPTVINSRTWTRKINSEGCAGFSAAALAVVAVSRMTIHSQTAARDLRESIPWFPRNQPFVVVEVPNLPGLRAFSLCPHARAGFGGMGGLRYNHPASEFHGQEVHLDSHQSSERKGRRERQTARAQLCTH